jgi:small multidrug resistance pump
MKKITTGHPSWMSLILKFAGVYNIIWGISVIFFPDLFFNLTRMELPRYPMIWQCVGMIVGVYGVGYWVAARDPIRHWPITLVGFLGKVFGPIGFAYYLIQGVFPLNFGLTIMTNDLLWWIPFGLILKMAWAKGEITF